MLYIDICPLTAICTVARFLLLCGAFINISWGKCGRTSVSYIPNSGFLGLSKFISNSKLLSEVVTIQVS